MRVRSIRPGEQVQSLWDDVNDPTNIFLTTDLANKTVLQTSGDGHADASPHTFYNESDAAEDAVLFPDELISPNRKVPFKEISNPITRMETTPATLLNILAEGITKVPHLPGDDNANLDSDDEDNKIVTHWSLPQLWEDAIAMINHHHISSERKRLLRRVGLLSEGSNVIRGGINSFRAAESRLKQADKIMIMERDRANCELNTPPLTTYDNAHI